MKKMGNHQVVADIFEQAKQWNAQPFERIHLGFQKLYVSANWIARRRTTLGSPPLSSFHFTLSFLIVFLIIVIVFVIFFLLFFLLLFFFLIIIVVVVFFSLRGNDQLGRHSFTTHQKKQPPTPLLSRSLLDPLLFVHLLLLTFSNVFDLRLFLRFLPLPLPLLWRQSFALLLRQLLFPHRCLLLLNLVCQLQSCSIFHSALTILF